MSSNSGSDALPWIFALFDFGNATMAVSLMALSTMVTCSVEDPSYAGTGTRERS